MKNIALHNLGCKVNAYEIDVMQQKLQERGYKIVPFDEPADIYIVNTCSVTNIADRKSRQMLHRAKARNPEAIVVAVGCYVQTREEEVLKDTGIDLAIGNNKKKDIIEILEEFLEKKERGTKHIKTLNDTTVIDINHTDEYEEMQLTETAEHTRAYIKIQDGCNQFCTYCIIPYARGRVRSRRPDDILTEIRGMAANGYKEVVLTGIHISSYGIDFVKNGGPRCSLIDLVEKIQETEGIERIRLGSLEPRIITRENAQRLGRVDKLCPHFHLSLQSGCDETLKRMNRHYTASEYYQCVEILREVFVNPAITTDVITGFPGETEEEFAATRDFLDRVKFYEMHVFKYSKRLGTKAAVMENQVPESVKAERSNELIRMTEKHSEEYRRSYIGSEEEVLFEETKEIDGKVYQIGHTRHYVKAAVCTQEDLANRILKGKLIGFLNDEILFMEYSG